MDEPDDRGNGTPNHPPCQPENALESAESTVARARLLSDLLFQDAKRMTEYRRMLRSRERCAAFDAKLHRSATLINHRLDPRPLACRAVVGAVVSRLARRIATWEHSPIRQRERHCEAGCRAAPAQPWP